MERPYTLCVPGEWADGWAKDTQVAQGPKEAVAALAPAKHTQ